MKGRIGYAIFWSSPGLEKLNILHAHKTSFLKPVTSRFSQRVPFLTRAVDVSRIVLTPILDLLTASTVFFSLVAMTSGRLPVHHHPTDLRALLTGQRFFLYPLFFLVRLCPFVHVHSTLWRSGQPLYTERSGPLVGDARECTLAGPPFFWSTS